jgi:hypothetical protein
MTAFEVLLVAVIAGAIGFQVWLTARVWKSELFDRPQKLMQSKLIWLVPIVGSMLVFSVLQEDDMQNRKRPPSQLRR